MKKFKNPYCQFTCKLCENKFKSYSILKMKHHVKKVHNQNLTTKSYKFMIKHHIIVQTIKSVLFIPTLLLVVALKPMLYLPHELYEFLDELSNER